MGNLGGQEILVILLVGLIVLGPAKLPAAIRKAGRFAAEARRVAAGFKQEFQEAIEEPLAESKAALAESKATLKAADPGSPAAPSSPAASSSPAAPARTSIPAGAASPVPATDSAPEPSEDGTPA